MCVCHRRALFSEIAEVRAVVPLYDSVPDLWSDTYEHTYHKSVVQTTALIPTHSVTPKLQKGCKRRERERSE
jgi:hypothetical protein